MVFDAVVNHWKSAENSYCTQNPCRDEHVHVAVEVERPSYHMLSQDKTHGDLIASACHATAAPADCNPLSVNTELRL